MPPFLEISSQKSSSNFWIFHLFYSIRYLLLLLLLGSMRCLGLLNSFTIAQKCIAIVPFQASYSECSWPPVLVCYHNGIPYFPWPGYVKGISFSRRFWATTDHHLELLARPLKFLSRPPLGHPNHIWHPILLTYNIPTWCLFYIDWTLHKGGEKMCPVIAAS